MSALSTYPMQQSTIQRIYLDWQYFDTKPEYQRSSNIWTNEKRQLFIDSILNDYDIPKIYCHALPRDSRQSKNRYKYAIIDGKQRLETLRRFISDEFPISDEFVYFEDPKIKAAGLYYSGLARKYQYLKTKFDSYTLPIILVETDDLELIEDMFSRLNEAVPLNSAEKRNAIGGPMVTTIRSIADHDFFKKKVRFGNNRFQHYEVAARILFVEHSISRERRLVDTKRSYLDQMVRDYKGGKYLKASDVAKEVSSRLDILLPIFKGKDLLLSSQSGVTILTLLVRQAVDRTLFTKSLHAKIENFHDSVRKNRKKAEENLADADFDLLEYDRLSVQGTNDASSIRERLRILSKGLNIITRAID